MLNIGLPSKMSKELIEFSTKKNPREFNEKNEQRTSTDIFPKIFK